MELTRENYHSLEANRAYVSCHQLQDVQACEAAAVAQHVTGGYQPPTTEAMHVGTYAHALALGQPVPADVDKALRKRNGELLACAGYVETMLATMRAAPLIQTYLEGERECIVTGTIAGVPARAMMDVLNRDQDYAADCKFVRDFEPEWNEGQRLRTPWYDRYWPQAAFYRWLSGVSRFLLLGVTKQEPPDHDVVELADERRLAVELRALETAALRMVELRAGATPKRCERCAYCRGTKLLTGPLVVRGE